MKGFSYVSAFRKRYVQRITLHTRVGFFSTTELTKKNFDSGIITPNDAFEYLQNYGRNTDNVEGLAINDFISTAINSFSNASPEEVHKFFAVVSVNAFSRADGSVYSYFLNFALPSHQEKLRNMGFFKTLAQYIGPLQRSILFEKNEESSALLFNVAAAASYEDKYVLGKSLGPLEFALTEPALEKLLSYFTILLTGNVDARVSIEVLKLIDPIFSKLIDCPLLPDLVESLFKVDREIERLNMQTANYLVEFTKFLKNITRLQLQKQVSIADSNRLKILAFLKSCNSEEKLKILGSVDINAFAEQDSSARELYFVFFQTLLEENPSSKVYSEVLKLIFHQLKLMHHFKGYKRLIEQIFDKAREVAKIDAKGLSFGENKDFLEIIRLYVQNCTESLDYLNKRPIRHIDNLMALERLPFYLKERLVVKVFNLFPVFINAPTFQAYILEIRNIVTEPDFDRALKSKLAHSILQENMWTVTRYKPGAELFTKMLPIISNLKNVNFDNKVGIELVHDLPRILEGTDLESHYIGFDIFRAVLNFVSAPMQQQIVSTMLLNYSKIVNYKVPRGDARVFPSEKELGSLKLEKGYFLKLFLSNPKIIDSILFDTPIEIQRHSINFLGYFLKMDKRALEDSKIIVQDYYDTFDLLHNALDRTANKMNDKTRSECVSLYKDIRKNLKFMPQIETEIMKRVNSVNSTDPAKFHFYLKYFFMLPPTDV